MERLHLTAVGFVLYLLPSLCNFCFHSSCSFWLFFFAFALQTCSFLTVPFFSSPVSFPPTKKPSDIYLPGDLSTLTMYQMWSSKTTEQIIKWQAIPIHTHLPTRLAFLSITSARRGAIAYFNPAGESFWSEEHTSRSWIHHVWNAGSCVPRKTEVRNFTVHLQ